LINHHRHNVEYKAKMALAQTQAGQQQFQAALTTYSEILKDNPLDRKVLDAQLEATMRSVENFSVAVPEGKDEGDLAGPALDAIFPVLNAGLLREKQARLDDVEAHLGWAHFLNAKMTNREGDSVAVKDWHEVLSRDPSNVYANAMLGNWMLQSYGDFKEAVEHFHTAVRTGRARPFVRQLEVGGLVYLDVPGDRAELIRVSNEMRKSGEDLDPEERSRVLSWCCALGVTNHQELVEALGAVPNDEAWQTFLWLEAGSSEDQKEQNLHRQFIHANLLEPGGMSDAALSAYRQIQVALRNQPGSLRDQIDAAVARLTRG
jgi:tetratricopeptide (TPR) repeat protein